MCHRLPGRVKLDPARHVTECAGPGQHAGELPARALRRPGDQVEQQLQPLLMVGAQCAAAPCGVLEVILMRAGDAIYIQPGGPFQGHQVVRHRVVVLA